MKKAKGRFSAGLWAVAAVLLVVLPLAGACTKEVVKEVPVERVVQKEVVKEVPVERVVEKQVIKEVPVEKVVVENWPKTLSIGSKGPESATYVHAAGVAEMLKKYIGLSTSVEVGKGAEHIARAIRDGEYDFGWVHNQACYESTMGLATFEPDGPLPLRTLAVGLLTYHGPLVHPKSGIKKLEDLKGKRYVYSKAVAPISTVAAETLLASIGLTRDDVKVLSYSGSNEGSAALIEGRADASGVTWTETSGYVIEAVAAGAAEVLPLTKEQVDYVAARIPFLSAVVLPAGSVEGQKEDQFQVASFNAYMTREGMPNGLAYAIVKTIYDHFDDYLLYHSTVESFRLPEALSPDRFAAPFHEGAIKYYKEKGLWGPAQENKQQELLKAVAAVSK